MLVIWFSSLILHLGLHYNHLWPFKNYSYPSSSESKSLKMGSSTGIIKIYSSNVGEHFKGFIEMAPALGALVVPFYKLYDIGLRPL